tara:strand:- start:1077 stop:2732 length:1656 start_codon:yes stop_codon:yes gene_type:complete
MKNNTSNNEIKDEYFLVQTFINILSRRRKIICSVFFTIFSISIFVSIFEGIFEPKFESKFKILIRDPIDYNEIFSSLNKSIYSIDNKSNVDLPSLIEVLKSNSITKKVIGGKIKDINIKVGGGDPFRGYKTANGILNISIYGDSKENTINLANSLSKVYLDYSMDQNKKMLTKGINLLSKLIPIQIEKIETTRKSIAKNKEIIESIKINAIEKKLLINNHNELINRWNYEKQYLIYLRHQISNLKLKKSNTYPTWQLISKPVQDPKRIYTSYKGNLKIGFISALFFAISIGFLKDKIKNNYYDNKEIKNDFDKIIFSSVPYIRELDEKNKYFISLNKIISKIGSNDKYLKLEESFYKLYTSLELNLNEKKIKSINITGTSSGEGRTTNSILLGKLVSDLGKKVLLIDANFRKPKIHDKLLLNNNKGLSDLLIGKENEWQNLIQKVDFNDNLYVMTAGINDKNILKLFKSENMINLINKINKSDLFDLIIWDSSAIYDFSEARLLASYLDGVILQISCGITDKDKAKDCFKFINDSTKNLLGILVSTNKNIF